MVILGVTCKSIRDIIDVTINLREKNTKLSLNRLVMSRSRRHRAVIVSWAL